MAGPENWAGTSNVAPTSTASTIVRTYKGKPAEASRLFQADAAILASQGYQPTSQQYVPGSWGCGAFLLALLLCLLVIGIIVFIYMVLVKPAGVLTVTYTRAQP